MNQGPTQDVIALLRGFATSKISVLAALAVFPVSYLINWLISTFYLYAVLDVAALPHGALIKLAALYYALRICITAATLPLAMLVYSAAQLKASSRLRAIVGKHARIYQLSLLASLLVLAGVLLAVALSFNKLYELLVSKFIEAELWAKSPIARIYLLWTRTGWIDEYVESQLIYIDLLILVSLLAFTVASAYYIKVLDEIRTRTGAGALKYTVLALMAFLMTTALHITLSMLGAYSWIVEVAVVLTLVFYAYSLYTGLEDAEAHLTKLLIAQ
ncbi:MAG: hypothetical protein ACP5KA_00470 [Desulfurococcaceae archaeon]